MHFLISRFWDVEVAEPAQDYLYRIFCTLSTLTHTYSKHTQPPPHYTHRHRCRQTQTRIVYVYIYIWVCARVCIYTSIHPYILQLHMQIFIHTYMQLNMYAITHVYNYTHKYT